MSHPLLYLIRHGQTAWTVTGQHTGLSDIPLTDKGEQEAARLRERLAGIAVSRVFTSPLQRARRTCELAGFGAAAIIDRDLVEWNYGQYDGKTRAQILQLRPAWDLFRDGCPAGETAADVGGRADRVIAKVRGGSGDAMIFSSGHLLRVLAARWLGLEPAAGRFLALGTAAVCTLGYEHGLDEPVVKLWNDRDAE